MQRGAIAASFLGSNTQRAPALTKGSYYMELFNKSGVLVSSVLVLVGALIACQAQEDAVPPPTVIEAAATSMGPNAEGAAEHRLREWAEQGSPVAQRELALRYLNNPARHGEAIRLLQQAARAGDAQAASGLDLAFREPAPLTGAARIGELNTSRLLKEAANANYTLR